jgi:hypothetical protein
MEMNGGRGVSGKDFFEPDKARYSGCRFSLWSGNLGSNAPGTSLLPSALFRCVSRKLSRESSLAPPPCPLCDAMKRRSAKSPACFPHFIISWTVLMRWQPACEGAKYPGEKDDLT